MSKADKIILENFTKQAKTHFDNITKLVGTEDFYLAGGALRDLYMGKDINDFDIFFNDWSKYNKALASLLVKDFSLLKSRKHSTLLDNGTYTIDLVMIEGATDAWYIINNFDIVCCCAAFGKDGLIAHQDFFKDIDEKKIALQTLKLPKHTFKRIVKHVKKGFDIDPSELKTLVDFAASLKDMDEEDEYDFSEGENEVITSGESVNSLPDININDIPF